MDNPGGTENEAQTLTKMKHKNRKQIPWRKLYCNPPPSFPLKSQEKMINWKKKKSLLKWCGQWSLIPPFHWKPCFTIWCVHNPSECFSPYPWLKGGWGKFMWRADTLVCMTVLKRATHKRKKNKHNFSPYPSQDIEPEQPQRGKKGRHP